MRAPCNIHLLAMVCLVVVLLAMVPVSAAAAPADSSFALVLYAGGGISGYTGEIHPPADIPSTIHRAGISGSVRVMWHPDHLLRVGLESGWTRFFSYSLRKNAEGNLYLSAIPMLVVFSMPVTSRLNVFLGAGGYLVYSDLRYETSVKVSEFSQGWMLAGNYTFPLGERVSLAAELKWFNASQFEDAALTAQVQIVWKMFEW